MMFTPSRIVASGDTTQVDLPRNTQSGLVDAVARLEGIDSVAQVRLSGADIVRHKIVQKIVEAYEKQSGQKQSR